MGEPEPLQEVLHGIAAFGPAAFAQMDDLIGCWVDVPDHMFSLWTSQKILEIEILHLCHAASRAAGVRGSSVSYREASAPYKCLVICSTSSGTISRLMNSLSAAGNS